MPRTLFDEKDLIANIRSKLLDRLSNEEILDQIKPGEALIALAILHSAAAICDDLQDIDSSIAGIELTSE